MNKKPTHRYLYSLCCISLLLGSTMALRAEDTSPAKARIHYGNDKSAGQYRELNGIKVYFEIHGKGRPMLQIHGNSTSIADLSAQIEFFSKEYQVIAADSRGHGKTGLGKEKLTYEQMAEDANALLESLNLKGVYVLGWSDGGIIGLLLAMHHPDKVDKLAIMGANLNPQGAYKWATDWVAAQEKQLDELIAKKDTSQPWKVYQQYLDLLGQQPNIPVESLKQISAPTLVMAADKDVIRDEHTLEIFHGLPKAELCIFPGATHMIPREDPRVFNETVDRFFKRPFIPPGKTSRPDTKDLFEKPGP